MGEVVEAKIIRVVSPNRAILLIKGRQLAARTPAPLRTDSVASFKVEQVAPECVLRLLQVTSDHPEGLASLIRGFHAQQNAYQSLIDLIAPLTGASQSSDKQHIPDILGQIWNLVRSISLSPGKSPDSHFFQSLIDGSGLLWENKLKKLLFAGVEGRDDVQSLVRQDLKGLALGALEDQGTMRLVSSEGISRFVDSLEQFQLANLVGLEEKGKLLLVIPMQWDDLIRFAQLLIDLSGNGEGGTGKDKKALTLSLLLDMSHLGPIRVDASVHERSVRVCFLVCSEEVQVLLNSFTDDLKSQLERHGFSVPQITCRVEAKRVLEKTSFVDALVDLEESRVSVMV
jgi:hypothetical protein